MIVEVKSNYKKLLIQEINYESHTLILNKMLLLLFIVVVHVFNIFFFGMFYLFNC